MKITEPHTKEDTRLISALLLTSGLDSASHLSLMFKYLACYNHDIMSSRSERDQRQSEPSRAEQWHEILGPDFDHELRRQMLVEAGIGEKSLSFILEAIGMAPQFDVPPPPGFLDKSDVTEGGLELNHELTPEEREYVNASWEHTEMLCQVARKYFQRIED